MNGLREAIVLHHGQVIYFQILEKLKRLVVVLLLFHLVLELTVNVKNGQVLVECLDREQDVVLLFGLLHQLVYFAYQTASDCLDLIIILDQLALDEELIFFCIFLFLLINK
jgi:hypothetical protein